MEQPDIDINNDYKDLRRNLFRETGAKSLTETDIALFGILKELRRMMLLKNS